MLAGRQDAIWLDQFVSDFSTRYAEPGGDMHGAYGYRWRNHFENVGSFKGGPLDQLNLVVKVLGQDPDSRQAVIQMWDAESDLTLAPLMDRPCNTQIYLRIQDGMLDMGVTCRSNDIVWGCYGANAVHFSILQEYLAARLRILPGKLTQFSWNWHMYQSAAHLVDHTAANQWPVYPEPVPLVTDLETFDREVKAYVEDPTTAKGTRNKFLKNTAYPMWMANRERKAKNYEQALYWAHGIEAPDWRRATVAWLERRLK